MSYRTEQRAPRVRKDGGDPVSLAHKPDIVDKRIETVVIELRRNESSRVCTGDGEVAQAVNGVSCADKLGIQHSFDKGPNLLPGRLLGKFKFPGKSIKRRLQGQHGTVGLGLNGRDEINAVIDYQPVAGIGTVDVRADNGDSGGISIKAVDGERAGDHSRFFRRAVGRKTFDIRFHGYTLL